MYHPFYHTRTNGPYTQSSSPCHHQPDCENPQQFQQSVRESIVLNHLSAAQMHSSPYQSRTSRFSMHHFCALSQIKVGSFWFRAPVRRAGCGGLLVSTDCVRRQWCWSALLCATAAFAAFFSSTFSRHCPENTERMSLKRNFFLPFFLGNPQ
jgi:hypothetical protein